jgi:hypothetical protein
MMHASDMTSDALLIGKKDPASPKLWNVAAIQ